MEINYRFSILITISTVTVFLFSFIHENSFAIAVIPANNNIEMSKSVQTHDNFKTPINMAAVIKNGSESANNDLNNLNFLLQNGDGFSFFKTLAASIDNNHSINKCVTIPVTNGLPNNLTTSNQSTLSTSIPK
jgi:hypothetical protein